jgi:phage shock protein B
MTVPWALTIPVIIFVGLIVPLWIFFHYVTAWIRMRTDKNATKTAATADLQALANTADKLEERLESLETILDADAPNWREK